MTSSFRAAIACIVLSGAWGLRSANAQEELARVEPVEPGVALGEIAVVPVREVSSLGGLSGQSFVTHVGDCVNVLSLPVPGRRRRARRALENTGREEISTRAEREPSLAILQQVAQAPATLSGASFDHSIGFRLGHAIGSVIGKVQKVFGMRAVLLKPRPTLEAAHLSYLEARERAEALNEEGQPLFFHSATALLGFGGIGEHWVYVFAAGHGPERRQIEVNMSPGAYDAMFDWEEESREPLRLMDAHDLQGEILSPSQALTLAQEKEPLLGSDVSVLFGARKSGGRRKSPFWYRFVDAEGRRAWVNAHTGQVRLQPQLRVKPASVQ